jgi:hypothetical protein
MRLVKSEQSDARNVSRIILETKWSGKTNEVKFEVSVVVRLKIQEQSELNFVSRIFQSRFIEIGNYPRSEVVRLKFQKCSALKFFSRTIPPILDLSRLAGTQWDYICFNPPVFLRSAVSFP